MNVSHNAARFSIGRRATFGLGLLAVYSVLPYFALLGPRHSHPTLALIPTIQALLLPVLIGTAYYAYQGKSRLVPAIGVTPACTTVLILGIIYPINNPEILDLRLAIVTAAAGLFFLAVSGVWTILGYAIGTALRWRRHDGVSKPQRTAAKRWIVITTAGIIPAYLVSVWLWIFNYFQTVYGEIVLPSVFSLG